MEKQLQQNLPLCLNTANARYNLYNAACAGDLLGFDL